MEITQGGTMKYDVIIIGAGASGLLCAIEAAKRGRLVLVVDHANKVGKKILMSGGGRCNFTNYFASPEQFESHNKHFCKSALKRYTQWDFIAMVERYQVAYHEKTLGQLFCDHKAKDIVEMLLSECATYGAQVRLNTTVEQVKKGGDGLFHLSLNGEGYACESLVVATGGLSIPTMGATGFGYQLAQQLGLQVFERRAGLVPFTLSEKDKQRFADLSGIAVEAMVTDVRGKAFREQILFTHRGLSGPAILQISSYWQLGESVTIHLCPEIDFYQCLLDAQKSEPTVKIKTILSRHLPKRVVSAFIDEVILDKTLAETAHAIFAEVTACLQAWKVKPSGTEGYRTAEVTLGGVDCDELSSKTMETKKVSGLYFIGEVVDVTGWLGGYNFQWAWSSGWAAGQVV